MVTLGLGHFPPARRLSRPGESICSRCGENGSGVRSLSSHNQWTTSMSDLAQLKQRLGNGLTENTFLLDPRTVGDLLNMVEKYTDQVPFSGQRGSNWGNFWMDDRCTPEALYAIYQRPDLAKNKLPVQRAFLLALLHLLEIPKALLNTIPARHRSLYYRDLLGFAPRAPQPDSVAVSFTLQKNASPCWLPAGSLLDGGQDCAGNSINYQTDDGLLISGQKLNQLCWTVEETSGVWKWYTAINTAKGIALPAEGLRLFTKTKSESETCDEKQTALYLGFSGTSAQDTLSVYWSVCASSVLDLTWWYYNDKAQWVSLDAMVQDNTAGLSVSNLWRVRLPDDIQPGGGEDLEAEYYWIKGTFRSTPLPTEVMPKLQGVLANAMTATLNTEQGIDDSHFTRALSANTIRQLVTPVAAIGDISQPFPSEGGHPRETDAALLQRAASRIAHRNRAVTWNDMRSLLMDRYPQIFDVRFPDVGKWNHLPAPVMQSLMVIPDGRYCDNDDALRPKLSDGRLDRMAQWLTQYTPIWAKAELTNPKYTDVTAHYKVKFVAGIHPDYGHRQLRAQLQQEYMPWGGDRQQAVTPGNKVDYFQLLAMLQASPLVQSVNTLVLSIETGNRMQKETQSITAKDDEVLILCPKGETD